MTSINRVSEFQFCVVTFFCTMAVKMFMLPALLLKACGRDGVAVIFVYLVIEAILTFLVAFVIKRNEDVSFFAFMSALFGKVGAKLVAIVFAAYLFAKLILMVGEIKIFFSTSIYDNISWEYMILPLIAVLVAYSLKPIGCIGRSAEIFLPFVLLGAIVLSFLLVGNVPLSNIMPLFENGASKTIDGALKYPLWFGDVALLCVFSGKVKPKKSFVAKAVVARVIGSLIVMFFAVIMFATYADVTDYIDYGHNVSSMTQYSLGSQEYGRFDYLVYSAWMFAIFIKASFNFFVLCECVKFIFPQADRVAVSLIGAITTYIVSTFVFSSPAALYDFCSGAVGVALSPIGLLIPLALVVAAITKYDRSSVKPADDKTNPSAQLTFRAQSEAKDG